MPEQGARLDQAAVVLQVFLIMDGTYAMIEEHKMDEARKKSWKSGNVGRSQGGQRMSG